MAWRKQAKVMHYVPELETPWPVDVRTLSSQRGFIISSLAPVSVDANSVPMAAVYGITLFDAPKVQRLLEDLVRRIPARRGRFDLKRFANPLRSTTEQWRRARSIDELLGDDDLSDHIYDRLVDYDRARHRSPQIMDLLGQPSVGLTLVTLATLEELESAAPTWSRMQLECWPALNRLPRGHVIDETFPPREGGDALLYCYRLYDIEHAADVLPEHYVRTFVDEIVRRAAENGIALDDLLENGRPTVFAVAAAAEALARGLMTLSEAIAFIKRRIAEKRAKFIEAAMQADAQIEPGLLLEVRRHLTALTNADRDFTAEELAEIGLQLRIHAHNPAHVARVIHGLSLVHARTNAPKAAEERVQYGPLSVLRREIGREPGRGGGR